RRDLRLDHGSLRGSGGYAGSPQKTSPVSISLRAVRLQSRVSLPFHLANKEPAMKFAFLGYHVEQNWASMSKCEQDAMIDDCFTYDSKLMKEGHLLDAGAAL